MQVEQMIRMASGMPQGSETRRVLVALLKNAVNPDTEDFVEWVLATQDPMSEADMVRYVESKIGRPPEPAPVKVPGAPSTRKSPKAPLEVGENVRVDAHKNTNTLNTDACEQYHNRVGQVTEKTHQGLVIQFYSGNADMPSTALTQDKQLFSGFASGVTTGLYRWTFRNDSIDAAEARGFKKVLFEAIYLPKSAGVDRTRAEDIADYVDKGSFQGDSRSRIYFSGMVVAFRENLKGSVFITLAATQRDIGTTNINPRDGKLLYIGPLGKRPQGWMEEAVKLGLRTP